MPCHGVILRNEYERDTGVSKLKFEKLRSICLEQRMMCFKLSLDVVILDLGPVREDFKVIWLGRSLQSCVQSLLEVCSLCVS